MSNHNYTKHYAKPSTEVIEESATVIGVVTNRRLLNVRTKPDANADVICVERALSELVIDEHKSTDEWFSVCTVAGVVRHLNVLALDFLEVKMRIINHVGKVDLIVLF